ncbi:MFS transporter [Microbacterium mitrae]|uniref:MFS transporter n=1 Tax=Microbacterium mitrae TaxID=664640 RepID=A0A5C8HPZ8_9MICO|nr:MFS transporter [Microbacterium mitrae]TXK04625.1 MFS transporter [Microbacterium mitrae]
MGAALLVGINLRPAITTVAALLQETQAAYALNSFWASALATLPVIAFGATAPLGPLLARRFGVTRALALTMAALAVALLLRGLGTPALLVGTFVAGAAIMAAGTLLPQYLKSLAAGGIWVGLSSMSFGVGAALGASLAIPLYHPSGDSVSVSLALWAAPAALAAVVMLAVGRRQPVQRSLRLIRLPRDSSQTVTIALVTGVFGLQALLYFAVTAYLPQLLISRGVTPADAGSLLAWFSLIGLLPTLVMPIVAQHRGLIAICAPALGVITSAALVWLASADGPYLVIVGILGAVQSGAFGLVLALIVRLAADPASAGTLSAIAQGVGYAIAGAGSFLIGVLYAATDSWSLALMVLAAVAFVLAIITTASLHRSPVALYAPQRP